MKMSLAETIDRYTILLIKKENGLNVNKELLKFKKLKIKRFEGLMDDLYFTNSKMWDIELKAEKIKDLKTLGKLFREQRRLNKNRITTKRWISELANEPTELKKYK